MRCGDPKQAFYSFQTTTCIKCLKYAVVEGHLIERENTVMQNSNEEYRELRTRMEQMLADLDRLRLGTVAIHVDHALCRLETIIAGGSKTRGSIKTN